MSYALGDIECAGTLRFPGGGTTRSTADGSWGLRYGFRTGCGSEHQEMACEKSMPPKATTRTPTASARYGHHTRIRVSSDHQWRCGSVIVQFSNFATGARPKPRCA